MIETGRHCGQRSCLPSSNPAEANSFFGIPDFLRLGIAKNALASFDEFELKTLPNIDMESSPKFPRDPGIQILTKNPVLSFFCKILFGKNENKLKEAVVGPFKK